MSLLEAYNIEVEPYLQILVLKLRDFISFVIHTFPSVSDNPEEEIRVYSNSVASEDQQIIILKYIDHQSLVEDKFVEIYLVFLFG